MTSTNAPAPRGRSRTVADGRPQRDRPRPTPTLTSGDAGRNATRTVADGHSGVLSGDPLPNTHRDRKDNPVEPTAAADQLLTVAQAAEQLGTTERFPRRLIAERRITYVKLGAHVRIPQSALDDFIAASTVRAGQ
jgi:excisionase family DNA binding protein